MGGGYGLRESGVNANMDPKVVHKGGAESGPESRSRKWIRKAPIIGYVLKRYQKCSGSTSGPTFGPTLGTGLCTPYSDRYLGTFMGTLPGVGSSAGFRYNI